MAKNKAKQKSKKREEVQLVQQKKVTSSEKIKELEAELAKTKYNKRTQFHVGLVKAKLARLKEKEASRGKGGGPGEGFTVRKTGDATVVLLGFPSVGKSTLLNSITNADSPVAAYAFTTVSVIPGLLEYEHAKIQILDVPGIVHGAASGKGRGKEVLQVIRNADLILVLIDVLHPEHYQAILKEVYETGVRLNQTRPDVRITKKGKGGLLVGNTVPLHHIDVPTVEAMAREMGIVNAEILIRSDVTPDQLIDIIEGNKIYTPALTVLNKIDLIDEETLQTIAKDIQPDVMVSANQRLKLEELKKGIFQKLQMIRVYLKEVNKKPDLEEPLIMRHGSTIRSVCEKLHKDFVTKFKYARIWGTSAKFDGQQFHKLDHLLQDGDILELHLR